MEEMSRCQVMRQVFRGKRKFSLVFVVTAISLSFLTFLCEHEVFHSVCGASTQVVTDGDRVKIKTSDAGIFVGVKRKILLNSSPAFQNGDQIADSDSTTNANANHIVSEHFINGVSNNESTLTDDDSSNGSLNQTVTVTTTTATTVDIGQVDGHQSNERIYYVFKGIPYSQPPEGSLRWKDPQIVDIKSSAQDNTKYKAICSQWSQQEKRVVGSQDCLYLNIFSPHIPPPLRRAFLPNPYTVQDIFYQQRHLYPVLIYIHGGDLVSGSGNFYGARKLLEKEDVVLVTFNYRLGIFGFLSNGGKEVPGNYGLLDQIQAIKWVHKYIQRFGGSPMRVTIFGDVGYLLLSPLAVGLFQGAVWMSDSWNMFSPPGNKSLLRNPKEFFREVAMAANCPVAQDEDEIEEIDEGNGRKRKNTKKFEMIECLKLKPVDELIRIQHDKLKFDSWPKRFVPVMDAGLRDFPVMMDSVDVLIQMGTLIKVPLIVGVNQLEGYTMLLEFVDKMGAWDDLRSVDRVKETLKFHLRFVLEEDEGNVYDTMFEAIWKFYFGQPEDMSYGKGLIKKLLGLFGDLKVHAGFSILSKKLTRNSKPPAFAYVFSHRVNEFSSHFRQQSQRMLSEKSRDKTSSNPKSAKISWIHQDIPPWRDLHYILNSVDSRDEENSSSLFKQNQMFSQVKSTLSTLPILSSSFKEEEQEKLDMNEIMIKIMTSFANYGTPKQAVAKFENWTRWHRIEPHNVRYYDLSLHPMSMKTSFRNAESNFWFETLPQVREMAVELNKLESFSQTTMFWILLVIMSVVILLVLSCLVYCLCLR